MITHWLQEEKSLPRLGPTATASMSAAAFCAWQGSVARWIRLSDSSLVPDVLGNSLAFCKPGPKHALVTGLLMLCKGSKYVRLMRCYQHKSLVAREKVKMKNSA